ncbi:flagellar protein FliT [Achromobacter sp. GG226]|uniref:flagellar protein FliT n=1 Tax=Verticiella alkaliphila TaxID=2779529 RepID=UPI001C0DFDF6|nr:flagellar protein FliT [Verticiella sp. GG226]MBU4610479.1 flagellar protein FliT [Verticiella sp. GG226]
MTPADHVLRLYRMASSVTREILDHAREADWDRVVALGNEYQGIVEQIRQLGEVPPLDADDLATKHALLVDIVENDAATRDLVVPSLERLGALIGTLRRQQTVNKTYGQGAAALR